MSEASDHWFVRFPDGKVLRAANTTIVRQQFTSGKIPPHSSVRRSPEDEWTVMEWTREFADLASPVAAAEPVAAEETDEGVDLGMEMRPAAGAAETGGLSARLDRKRLGVIGVRPMMHELLAALDGTLVRKKLMIAALAGLCAGLVLACLQLPAPEVENQVPWVRSAVAVVLVIAVVTATAAMLTRMTFTELSRMRPARFGEGAVGLAGTTIRIATAQLLTAGLAFALIVWLRYLPDFLLSVKIGAGAAPALASGATAVGMVVEVVLWPIIGFALLLPPILVVENCSVDKALSHWLRLLRVDLGRVFLYEALALGLGMAATLLLAVPWLALLTYAPDDRVLQAVVFTRWVLAGLAVAPLLAYLMVANVFIYINLRYESAPARR